MGGKRRGCLLVLLALILIAGLALFFVVRAVPGDIHLGAPADKPRAGVPTTGTAPSIAPGTSSPGGGSTPPVSTSLPDAPPAAWMTYVIPEDILQAELQKAFPIRQNVFDLVKLRLDRPEFVPDEDGRFLRLRLAVEVRVLEGNDIIPGSAEVRTRLAYDAATRRVLLRDAQLVDLALTGEAAQAARALQPVLAAALAAEMEGYAIVQLPAEGLGWLKPGVAFVRDVYVYRGRVAVAFGP